MLLNNSGADHANKAKNDRKIKGVSTFLENDLDKQSMKRINNIYHKIYSIENLMLADKKAKKGKSQQYGIKVHNKNRAKNILAIHRMLKDKTYKTSEYKIFTISDPKERIVYKLPFYPDRIVHHAIMNIIKPVFVSTFTANTFSCIKGRGIHAAARSVQKALRDVTGTEYCLKLDIVKFYPNINHAILKELLRKKFKDSDLLWLLDEIIDSAEGIPIGNYLSQYLANFYLTYFDHWIKEQKQVKYYFRYADDIVVLSDNKPYLHKLLSEIRKYFAEKLKLSIKGNYQVFPVKSRSLDFVGYRFYHTHTWLRDEIKKSFARAIARGKNKASIASYMGWAKHCDSKHLVKKLLHETV